MKLNKIMLAAAMTFGAVSLAQAASQGSGQINFTGSIVDAPCSIKGESIRQDINLGGISKALLAKKDGHSTPQQVNIQLENCDLTDKNGVTLTFSGIANDKDQSMLALAGNASDAGIVFIDSRGEKIKLGEASQPAKLAGTSATLSFNVYVAAASASTNIVPGDFTAVTNFELAYQ
ncbi:fimbrial protein [Erwinia sp. V90_4]|jgi:type 1 fimbria pilin|uniref:fimbrial protein n=1 Tax=Erwinia sp. V90_4 TaxID=3044239 RepID=UPI00249D8FE7|nr:fimbrial protein [Erwinia sp. V90_4]MDI3440675.1 fimbrial protein [Erwinia sp. V90_4]